MGHKSRNKGAQAERDIINLINVQLGLDLERNPYRQCKEAGHYDVVGLDWMAMEVKRYATASDAQVYNWWVEACRQADEHRKLPVLAYRADRQDWHIVVPLNFVQTGDMHQWMRSPNAQAFDMLGANLTVLGFCDLIRAQLPTGNLLL